MMASGPLQTLITRLARRELQDRIGRSVLRSGRNRDHAGIYRLQSDRITEYEEMTCSEPAASHRTITEDRTRTGASVQ